MHENFFHKLKVYYEDTDSGGVVYYANYLKYLERARTEALFSIGFSNKKVQENYNSLIIVKSCNIEYKKPAHLEDELKVRSFVKSITKTSFFMNQIITKNEEVIVEESEQKFYKILETTKTVSQDYYDSAEERDKIYQQKLLNCEKKNNLLVGGDAGFVEFISDLETEERDV